MNPIFSPSRFYETYPELANPVYQEALPYHSYSCNDVIYLRSEVERLTGTCKALDEENLRLKTCSTQDQTLLADNERLLHELTVLRDSKALDKDSILIHDLTEDNRRLSYELSETMKDSEEWRSKYLVLEKRLSEVLTKETHYIADLEGLNAVLGDRDRTIRDLRAKINAQFDLVRMNEGLRREEEVLRATIRERDHTIELMRRDQDVQIGWLQQENNRLKRIIDEMNADYETLKMRSKEGSESHHIANELQIKVTSLNNEITELKRIIMGKDIEMEHLRTKVNDLVVVEKELKSSLKEKSPEHLALEDRFDEILNESEKLKSSLAGKTKECEGLKTKIAQYIESDMIATASLKEKTTLLEGVEAKLKALEKENNAQKGLASEKTKECDLLKVKLTRAENDWEKALKEKTDFGNELQKMEKEFARQKKKKAELKAKVKEIDLMENKMRQMSMEKERLLQTIADKNTEIKKIEMKVQRLESEVAQVIELRARITNLTDENKTWKSKMSEKDEKIKALNAEIAQMKEKMTVIKKEKKEMLTEKEKLNTTISEKTREIALLRSEATKVGMLSEKLLSLESEKEKLMNLLERKKKEFVRESEMNRILIEELKTQLASLQLKNNTNTNWRDEIAKLIEENAKLKARCALLEKDSLLINDLKLRLARE